MIFNLEGVHSNEKNMKNLCDQIVNGTCKVYLFGRNEWAADISNYIEVSGFIDQFTTEEIYKEKPIIKDIGKIDTSDSIVISCVVGRPWTVKIKLDSLTIKNIDYFSFWKYSGLPLMDYFGWAEFKRDFDKNGYENVYDALEDEFSKIVIQNIINFRLSQDFSYLKFFPDRQIHQYFEPFLDLSREIFLDVGGYDGFTSKQILFHYPECKGILFFEPDSMNMSQAKENLKEFDGLIQYFQNGVGNCQEQLCFSHNGSSSSIDEEGDQIIQVTTIDSVVESAVVANSRCYLKMDIEGWEMKALEGAQHFILNHKPKIAVCVYHKPHDILTIFNYVKSLNPDYRVYLRHYSEGVFETVMYFC